jgi:hypothetical protein
MVKHPDVVSTHHKETKTLPFLAVPQKLLIAHLEPPDNTLTLRLGIAGFALLPFATRQWRELGHTPAG